MGLIVFKIALVVFLVIAVGFLAVTFIRRSRAKGFPTRQSSSHLGQIKGAMPPTPKPEWPEWPDQEGGEPGARTPGGGADTA
ncbi:MAG TPA: hypothetical protein VGO30_19275 [Mycobacterium sp.]|jgi:hypothetical protein|nr:hypothetical protein [Mycobacterium sp.]